MPREPVESARCDSEVPTAADSPDSPIPNRVGWVVVVVAVLLRAAVTWSGAFYWDDFILEGRAARLPVTWDYVWHGHDGHLMPGTAVASWLTERAAPLDFWLPAAEMVALQSVVAVGAWLLLRRIFGRGWGAVALTGITVLTPLTLPGSTWWAAALNALPMQLGMLATTWGAWLVAREGREWRGRVWMLVGWLGALAFFEKAMLLVLWLPLAVWVFSDSGGPWRWARGQWRARRWFWLTVGAATAAYLLAYRAVSDREVPAPKGPGVLVDAVWVGLTQATLPALLGGPGGWESIGYGGVLARPPSWLVVLALAALVAVVAVSVRGFRARRAWISVALYTCVSGALIAVTRLYVPDGPALMAGMRYTADSLLPIVLALGISTVAISGEASPWLNLISRLRVRMRDRTWTLLGGMLATLTALVVGGLLVSSWVGFWALWSDTPAKYWLANARTSLAAGADDGALLDQTVPDYVLAGLANPYHRISWLLAPLPDRPPFAQFTTNPRFVAPNGTLTAGTLDGVEASPTALPSCLGAASGLTAATIPLTADVFEWEHLTEITYHATAPVTGSVRLGDGTPTEVAFSPEASQLVTVVEGGGTTVTISAQGLGDGSVCLSQVKVGVWRPLADR